MLIPTKFSGYRADGSRVLPIMRNKAPDMSGANAAAREAAQISREQWDDFKTTYSPLIQEQMRSDIDRGKEASDRAFEQQDFDINRAKQYDERYWGVQVPLEDRIIDQAVSYNEPAERERMAGEARADVEQAFANSEGQAARGLGRYGVNPNSGRFAGAIRDTGIARASLEANAMNKTRQAAKDIGWARLADAAALGRGLPGFAGASTQNAQGWSSQGLNNLGMNSLTMGNTAATQTAGSSSSGLNAASNTMRSNAAESIKADNQFRGAVTGAGLAMMSDRRLKQDIVRVGIDLPTGLTLYEFAYRTDPDRRFRGVMADEVEQWHPRAVLYDARGYAAVDYTKLGIEMVEV